jgi:hypothetical protein
MVQYSTRDFVLMGAHIAALGFALVVTILCMSFITSADDSKTPYHITNTFLSTFDSKSTLNTYIPLSKPLTREVVNSTFYTCLMNAEVAIDNIYKCKADNLDLYSTCINNLVTTNYKVVRMLRAIKTILGEYEGEANDVAQLPSWLTSVDTPATLESVLTADNSRYALKKQLELVGTPLSVIILNAIVTAESLNGIPSCFAAVSTVSLKEYSTTYDLSTAFDSLWKCTTDVILVSEIQKRAYDKCIPLSAWPARDVMQTAYTDTMLGSYNKYFILWIAMWLMSSFVVYTSPGYPSPATPNGKPKLNFARAGKIFVTFGFVWNLAAILIVVIRTFVPASSFKDAPMSVQTALTTLFFTISASIYFGREVYELFFLSSEPPEFKYKGTSTKASSTLLRKRNVGGRVYQGIAAFMDPPSYNEDVPDEEYLPLVAPVWNDSWFFVDGLLFLTVAGMSYDVVTVDIVVCVFCILATALCNSALVRLLYEGYINRTSSQNVNESVFVIRVMSVIASVSGLFFSIIAMILVAMRFTTETISFYVAFTLLVPQVVWVSTVVIMEFNMIKKHKGFFWLTSIFFAVNVFVRCGFVAIWILANFDRDYKLTSGDDDSLHKLLAFINTNAAASPGFI